MKCYVCAEQGKDTDAVAICIVCGMGLCTEHAIREETEIWSGGYPFPAEKVKGTLPRILCPYCYNVMKED
ncbi:DUF2180 family protein [Methanothermobacter thermautotrophicus]|jgi:hypothetical protein|nr:MULTISPECIES: DUF2180 family protein [Methanothermobacter]MBC7111461.1 DUF2180 family protein [Methanothermobacter sp.]MBE2899308.1 DUF2180 family protein [Methanothermobacter thermautotrophicus]MCQ8905485.1 DUF2180 family protein [Methanothermobacter sp.]MDI6818340.1 DUF2180 family protein [Methanothermobacter thermautotrophicus]NLU04229.1 DUF2180 family protein [Methanothermobacter sp.]